MIAFHCLLVAVDGSPNADLALEAALTVCERDHASLTLIAVTPDVVAEASRWPGAPAAPASLQADADAATERILREAVERIPADIPVTTVLRRGRAGPEILAYASTGAFDAIVLGARGVGRVGALMGSVRGHVLHHADVAVFVAHAPRGEPVVTGSSPPGTIVR